MFRFQEGDQVFVKNKTREEVLVESLVNKYCLIKKSRIERDSNDKNRNVYLICSCLNSDQDWYYEEDLMKVRGAKEEYFIPGKIQLHSRVRIIASSIKGIPLNVEGVVKGFDKNQSCNVLVDGTLGGERYISVMQHCLELIKPKKIKRSATVIRGMK